MRDYSNLRKLRAGLAQFRAQEEDKMNIGDRIFRIGIMCMAFIGLFCIAIAIWGCDGLSPTGSTVPTQRTTLTPFTQEGEFTTPTPDPTPDPEPRQAFGELILRGNYGDCVQSTDYHSNYLSIHRIVEGGLQPTGKLFRRGEGSLAPWCGKYVQIDCTVRDQDPTPNNISAYDLYAFFIGVLDCGERPSCVGDCGPPPPPPVCDDIFADNSSNDECPPPPPPSCPFEAGLYTGDDVPEQLPSNPGVECAAFGQGVPGVGIPGYFINKCGQDYLVSATPKPDCSPSKHELSHTTPCYCLVVD
jgi:hypothetical protein